MRLVERVGVEMACRNWCGTSSNNGTVQWTKEILSLNIKEIMKRFRCFAGLIFATNTIKYANYDEILILPIQLLIKYSF